MDPELKRLLDENLALAKENNEMLRAMKRRAQWSLLGQVVFWGLFVVAPLGGGLVNRFGERPLVAIGVLLQAVGTGWMALLATPDLAYARLVAPMIVAGAGVSMAIPAVQNVVLSAVAPAEIGKASGAFNMFRYLGGVFGIALLVEVFARAGGLASPQAFSAGFAQAMGVGSALSLLGAAVALRLPARRRPAFATVDETTTERGIPS